MGREAEVFPGQAPAITSLPPSTLPQKTSITRQVAVTSIKTGTSLVDSKVTVTRQVPAFTFGRASSGTFRPIAREEDAQVGDVLRITYRTKIRIFERWQIDRYLAKLQQDERFELRHYVISDSEGKVWVEVRLLKPFSPVLLVALGVAAVGVGLGLFFTVESIEKLFIFEVAPGQKVNLAGFAGIAGLALLFFTLVKR